MIIETASWIKEIIPHHSPTTFITRFNYVANYIKFFNNVTFLYDNNWDITLSSNDEVTFPIVFYHIKSLAENMNSDVSDKPLLFYNSGMGAGGQNASAGLLNVVADNIVARPKQYNLEVLIPRRTEMILTKEMGYEQFANVFNVLNKVSEYEENKFEEAYSHITERLATVSHLALEMLLKYLIGSYNSAGNIIKTILDMDDYNKRSLEQMWRNRNIIQMKMWNGWNFVPVVIRNIEISKDGLMGDYYTGKITVQEVPIMTLRDAKSNSVRITDTTKSAFGKIVKKATENYVKQGGQK